MREHRCPKYTRTNKLMKHKLIGKGIGKETKTGSVKQNTTPENKTYKTNQEANILPANISTVEGYRFSNFFTFF